MKNSFIPIFLSIFILISCESENKKNKDKKADKINFEKLTNSYEEVKHLSFTQSEKNRYSSQIERDNFEVIPDNIFSKIDKKVIFIEFYMEFSTFSNLPPTYRNLFYKENQNFSLPGILLDKKHVLTNYDILKDSTLIFLKENNKNKNKIAFSIKGYDENLNLVVLESNKEINKEVVVFKKSKIFAGDQIFSLGTINGIRKVFKRGIINILHYSDFNEIMDSFFVSSLSPIVNIGSVVFDANSEVVGIVTSYNPYYENSAYVVSSSVLVNLIKKLKKGYVTKSKSWLGLHIEKNNKKIVVRNIIKNSPAEKSGLQKGDVLLQINKIKLKNRRHLKKILSFLKPENRIILKVKRKNTIIAIKLQTEFKPLK